jgi:hypothetical protein
MERNYVSWAMWRMANLCWWETWAPGPPAPVYRTSFDKRSHDQDTNAWAEWRKEWRTASL